MDEPDDTQTVGVAAPAASRAPRLAELALPSRFTPLAILGEGAMGYVIEARDETLGRDVAVKLISPKRLGDARSRDRFLREARAVATLRHENIVTVHDLDPHGKFLVMELVRGETVRDRIARDGPLGAAEARRIGAALLAGLATAHDAGIVHRDVKPANVLLGADGTVKLADFGVATIHGSELTHTGEAIGTPAYMAPEQLRGHGSDRRVDVYAAGATLFEITTGQRLHSRPGREDDLRKRIAELVPDRTLAGAIAIATREDPGERFADARAFAAALVTPRRRSRLVAIAAVGALAVIGGGIAVYRIARDPEPAPLARGLAALEQQDFVTAETQLRAASATPVTAAKAHYYLAILYWWTSRATPEVLGALDQAIERGLEPRLAEVATGVRELVNLDYPAVTATFERLRQKYPDDRDVLYGAYEAQFHGGEPATAHATYRELRKIAPAFGLGRHHMLGYLTSRNELAPAREIVVDLTGAERARWDARISVAQQRYPEARARLIAARAIANEREAAALGWELAVVHALAGDITAAHALAVALSAKNMQGGTVPLLGIALARGTVEKTDAIDFLWRVAINAANVPPSIITTTREGWLELAPFIVIGEDAARARVALDSLPHDVDRKMIETALARTLLAGTVGDRDAVERFRASPFPVVRHASEAMLDELDRDHTGAAAHWLAALASDGFVRFRIAMQLRLARALRAANDRSGALAACKPVIRPPMFHWSWGAAVGECLVLDGSRAAAERVLELRAAAPATDPLVMQANASLSADRTPP